MNNIHIELDSVTEHRRLQNRLSQRKFRQKKALEQKKAQATFELVPADTVPNQVSYDSPESQNLRNHLFPLNSSTTSYNDVECDGSEGAAWEVSHQNSPHQSQSMCSPINSSVSDSMDIYTDLEMLGGRAQASVSSIIADLNKSIPTSAFDRSILPLEPNVATASGSSSELGSSDDSPCFRQWLPNSGASPMTSNSETASIKSGSQSQYQLEASSRGSSSSTSTASGQLPPLLHVSAQIGDRRVVQSLLNHGALVNERDRHGRTALHVASEHGHDAIVSLLLAHGADYEALDQDGKSALYLAVAASHVEVVDILLKHR